MQIDWGSVPDWLAGGGAVAALLWARKAARAASRTDERQGEQLALIEREKQRSQAEHIAVWFDFDWDTDRPHRVMLRNASELPVYEVFVWVNLTVGSVNDEAPPEGEPPPRTLVVRYVYCLAPASEAVSRNLAEVPKNVPLYSDTERFMQYLFRDAAGRYWHRTSSGDLVSTTEERCNEITAEVNRLRGKYNP